MWWELTHTHIEKRLCFYFCNMKFVWLICAQFVFSPSRGFYHQDFDLTGTSLSHLKIAREITNSWACILGLYLTLWKLFLALKDSKVTRMLNVSCLKYSAKYIYKYIPCKCCTTSLWHPVLLVLNMPCMSAFVAWGRGNSVRKNCLNCFMNHKSRKGMKVSPAPYKFSLQENNFGWYN